jgi:hypothetical protein
MINVIDLAANGLEFLHLEKWLLCSIIQLVQLLLRSLGDQFHRLCDFG